MALGGGIGLCQHLIATAVGARAALVVDRIIDQRQVVIKSLEANYGRVPGIAAGELPNARPTMPAAPTGDR